MAIPGEKRGNKSYTLDWVTLDKHVLLVRLRSGGINYGCYIGAVRGEDNDAEALGVVGGGTEVRHSFPEVFFNPEENVPGDRIRTQNPYFNDNWLYLDDKGY